MKPFVEINLDKPRRLRYTINALVALEEKLGKPISAIDRTKIGIKEFRLLLWAGLIHEDPNLTEEKVGELMDEADINYIAEKINEAIQISLGMKGDIKNVR